MKKLILFLLLLTLGYNICVTVYTSCGDSASKCRSDSIYKMSQAMINVNVMPSTGISTMAYNNQLQLFPCPAADFVRIEGPLRNGTLEIIDAVGNVVQREKFNSTLQLRIADLPSGLYFVRVSSSERIYSNKFIKQ